MSSQPSYPPAPPRQNGVAIACILSGGLITAAIINSHRPAAPAASTSVAVVSSRATPPIAQDAVQQQFEAQIGAQKLAPEHVGQNETGPDYDFHGVKIKEVDYSTKEDAFTIIYTPLWQVKPASNSGNMPESLYPITSATATNDGYGHYTGSANVGGNYGDDRRDVDFTLR